ncbi:LLM class flavin-dependent oxidoreductase [Cellulomonas sp. PS-H5]|uniref:LLM class flavin-dependent oxidoreductase n=1 Tax=Cellulomonas sp. PS-H5 TaxID=2820400 RepID=UPI001C4FB5DC|nr:LLM class flavin-dependent oxidoreductase [Cellulomonas sp. PS-H5]MBW0254281.1 LLM class flavin-dependent oxidoreductase [Cellulomonas sp. PS-H5]
MTVPPLLTGLDVDGAGAHPAAAALSGLAPADLVSGARLARAVRHAEHAGLTFVTFADAALAAVPGDPTRARLDAVTRAAFVARTTTAIGLVPEVPTTYPEPFHVATQLASLDLAGSGRSGWLAAVTPGDAAPAAYGRAPVADLGREARDVVQVVRDLWDSWEDDAVIRDVATGRYVDRDRIHRVDFAGESFSVVGPLITPRPPQGQPVVLARAGDVAGPGRDGERLVDVVLVGGPDAAGARAAAQAAADADPGARAVVEVQVVLDAGGRTAADRLAELDAAGLWAPGTALRHVGTAAGLHALLAELADDPAVAGVRLLAAALDADLPVLARDVLPALRADRRAAAPRAGATLRDHLGLARPENRFAGAARATA